MAGPVAEGEGRVESVRVESTERGIVLLVEMQDASGIRGLAERVGWQNWNTLHRGERRGILKRLVRAR